MHRFSNLPAEQLRLTLPTLFTISRLLLIPGIIAAMILGHWGYAFYLFFVAALTDSIDGFLARALDCQTILGAALDAIADKLLVVSIFATLAFIDTPLFKMPGWFVFLVLLKESFLVSGTAYIYFKKGSVHIKPSILGKMTMFMQVAFIVWLFSCYFFTWLPIKTYYTMLGLLLGLVGACLLDYAYNGWRFMIGEG